MAKSFISFLGTNDYTECRYILDRQKGPVVKYVQEDMIHRFCSAWSEGDEIRIFTTSQANQKNWKDNGHKDYKTKEIKENAGLGGRLNLLGLKPNIKQIDIPIGNSEKEIWEIFNIVYTTMQENEEIIIDITHSLRSIPVLFMALAGYAGVMKNVLVSGIYYGAFEIFGRPAQVEKEMPDPRDREIPIFDLTSFVQLTEWSQATHSFIHHGSADDFLKLVGQKTSVILRETQGQDTAARNINLFAKNMRTISRNMQFNRGAGIINHDYETAMKNLQETKNDPSFIPPFGPLLEKIEQKINVFKKDDIKNGFKAVEWCMDHGLIQQAVTMLQESIISYVLDLEGLAWSVRRNREQTTSALHFIAIGSKLPDDIDHMLAEKFRTNSVVKAVSSEFQSLKSLRNDLNHGGFVMEQDNKSKSSDDIQRQFEKIYQSVKQKIF
ncbi:TM1812 family CRISPR-associated protein [Desulfobacula sp.]